MKGMYRFIVVLVLFALLLTACSPAASTQQAPAEGEPAAEQPAPAEPVNLTMWVESFGDGLVAQCIIDEGIAPYNDINDKGITIEAIAQPNNWDAVRTAVSGGGGPDIVITPGPSYVAEMAAAGQLLPLDEYAEKFGWSEQFYPWAMSLGKVDGKLYSIPHEIEALVLFYNKTVFEEHGWQPPATMDEFLALAEEIKQAGLIPLAGGNAEWRPTNEWYLTEFFNAYAGPEKVYKALKGEIPWTDPDFAAGVNLLTDAMQKGYWQGGLENYYTAMGDEVNTMFGAGEAAMMLTGSWSFGDWERYFGEAAGNSNDWDWVPTPSRTGEHSFSLGIGSTYSINSASEHPEAAAEFLTYYFSPENQGNIMSKCGVAPAPINITEKELQGLDPRRVDFITQLSEAAAAGDIGYTTWTFWPPQSDVYIYEEIEKVWAGTMTTEQYLEGLNDLFQKELADGSVPPIPERQ